MQNITLASLWAIYRDYVTVMVLGKDQSDVKDIHYWRNRVFLDILTYLVPVSVIAFIPCIAVSFQTGLIPVAVVDIFFFASLIAISSIAGLTIRFRKLIFFTIFYSVALVLLYYVDSPAPGLLILLTLTILISIIFSPSAGYWTVGLNTLVCLIFGLPIYLKANGPALQNYNMLSWIALASNLVVLSFTCAHSIKLLLSGLETTIGESVTRQHKLNKANRLYAFISAVNQSIVQINDKQALLDNICGIALQTGKFKTAWIGLVDADRKLNIASIHGTKSGIERVTKHSGIYVDNPLIKNLSTGKVLHTGKYIINNDMQNDPAYQVWKEEFIQDDIKASICLPIFMSEKVVGVFSLQTGHDDFFDAQEIELLTEAAGDISFALENFEKESLRRKAEATIIKEEARLKQAQSIAHIGHWEFDFIAKTALWSDEACRIYGFEQGDNIHSFDTWASFLHPEDADAILKKAAANWETMTDYTLDYRIIRRNGTIAFIHTQAKFEFDLNGNTVMIYGVLQDVTAHKISQQNLETSEKRFREFFENAPEAITIIDVNTKYFIEFNQNALKLLKLTDQELKTKGPVTISPEYQPDGRLSKEKARELISAAMDGAKPVFEWLVCNGEGKEIMCEVRLSALSNNNKPQLLASFVDISERKKTEQQQALFVSIVNSSDDAIISKEPDGTITGWNHGAEKVLGYSSEEVVGKNISLLIPPGLMEEEKGIQEKIRKSESVAHYETQRVKKNGELIYVSLTVSPIKDASGKIIGASKILRDMTDRKEAENLIKELNENLEVRVQERTAELSEANKALEAFSSTVSHDLRAPVRAINSFVKIIKVEHGASLNPDLAELFRFIEDSGKRMSAIIDDLLKLAKYGKEKLKLEPVDMTALVSGVWANISRTTQHKAMLKLAELPEVIVDMSMMQQVVVNLLTNAIKYSSKKDNPVITIWCEQGTGSNTFYFQDNGAGFDMEHYEKLFGAFQRLHTAQEFEGTGVGLALVKRIIEKHGGTIAATAKEGEGATFYFTLPVKR